MGRGFLSGIFWGGIVGVVALFASSQTLERQTLSFPKPKASAVEVPGGSEFDQARPESDPIVPEADERPAGEDVAGVPLPDDSTDKPPTFDTSALEVPVPSTTQDAPESLGDAPEETADVGEPSSTPDQPVENDFIRALDEPESPGQAPATEAGEPAAPSVETENDEAPEVATDAAPSIDGDEPEIAALAPERNAPEQPEVSSAPQVSSQTEAPESPEAPNAFLETLAPKTDEAVETALGQAPEAPKLPAISNELSLPDAGESAPEAPAVAALIDNDQDDPPQSNANDAPQQPSGFGVDDDDPVQNDGAEKPADVTEAPAPVEPEAEAADAGQSNRVGALPTVRRLGESQTNVEESPDEGIVEAAETDEIDPNAPPLPALQAFASEFEAPDNAALVSIVLVPGVGVSIGADLLAALPEHVAIAVDASGTQAEGDARAYRASGREVVMVPSLPAGAAPQDVEQALSANLQMVPEAVAVMDVSGSSFQSDRSAVAQVVDMVQSSGHGLITFPRGLNSAHQQAQRAGVPTGLIFRNLDAGQESEDQIRRSLDRAAFRARQSDAVILVASARPETLSALIGWAESLDAATVVIAPVSRALSR